MLGVGVGLTSIAALSQNRLRLIPTFAGSQYGTLNTPITFTGDFEVEVEFATTDNDGLAHNLVGNSSVSIGFIRHIDGVISVHFGINRIFSTLPLVNDGKVHTALISVISNTSIRVTLEDGSTQILATADTSTNALDRIGNKISSEFFIGQILSTKFTDQSGASDVVTNYVFDSGSTTEQYARGSLTEKITLTNFATTDWERFSLQQNIAYDSGVISQAWVGDDVVVNGRFETDSDWNKGVGWSISGGKAISDGSQVSVSTLLPIVDTVPFNSINLVSIDLEAATGAGVQTRMSSGTASGFFTSISTHKHLLSLGVSGGLRIDISAGDTATIDNVKSNHLLEIA